MKPPSKPSIQTPNLASKEVRNQQEVRKDTPIDISSATLTPNLTPSLPSKQPGQSQIDSGLNSRGNSEPPRIPETIVLNSQGNIQPSMEAKQNEIIDISDTQKVHFYLFSISGCPNHSSLRVFHFPISHATHSLFLLEFSPSTCQFPYIMMSASS